MLRLSIISSPFICLQTVPGLVPKTLHELIPIVVVFVGAAIDHEAPRSMIIFLKIPLDIVGVVVMRGVFRRPWRWCVGSMLLHMVE